MDLNSQLNIDLPIETILTEKIKYHLSQISHHKLQIEELEKALSLLSNKGIVQSLPPKKASGSALYNNDFKVSQKTIRPFVESYLQENNGAYTTSEIFNGLLTSEIGTKLQESSRRDCVASISSTLNALVLVNKVIGELTGKGREKKYRWIR
ncbi:hypothetical protein [Chitinophaga polysaccharea]|uniref:hypothetical protein n=1 Tax=Chitinophaga polysaccharea TaxID=1293035 RepID=UPI00115AE5D6|nr:hypothetical protein [Chitinophaga polysaccharea]